MCHALKKEQQQQQQKTNKNIFFDVDIVDSLGCASWVYNILTTEMNEWMNEWMKRVKEV